MRSRISRFGRGVDSKNSPSGPADRRPVVDRRRLRMPQRRRDHLEVGEFAHDLADHRLELLEVELRVLVRHAADRKAERRGKILFVADQDVDQRHEAAIDGDRALVAAVRAPQRFAVVEIERHDGAAPPRRVHRFARDLRRRLGQRAEDAAGVQPARAVTLEDRRPVDVARRELRDRRVAAVRTADRRANPEAALDEVQAVAARRGRRRRT